jgi:broad specificity phosphatase PhoE
MAINTLEPPSVPTEPPARPRPGAIILARHGEPALSRKVKLDSDGYRTWWAKYELGGLLAGQTPPAALVEFARDAVSIHCSTRLRSQETAQAIVGGRAVADDVVFIEAPLPPPRFPSFFKVSPKTWGFLARFWWWFFNHHAGEENRKEAEARAGVAADRLIVEAEQGDVLLVAHGFFNELIGRALKARGWKLVRDEGYRYWSTRRFEKR